MEKAGLIGENVNSCFAVLRDEQGVEELVGLSLDVGGKIDMKVRMGEKGKINREFRGRGRKGVHGPMEFGGNHVYPAREKKKRILHRQKGPDWKNLTVGGETEVFVRGTGTLMFPTSQLLLKGGPIENGFHAKGVPDWKKNR